VTSMVQQNTGPEEARSTSPANGAEPSLWRRLQKYRRKRVKKFGKRLIRVTLSDFFQKQSLVSTEPFVDPAEIPQLMELEKHWRVVRAELEEILKFREAIPGFQDISPDQRHLATEKNWRTFVLYGFGRKIEENCKQAPETTRLMEQIPGIRTVWFSILAPHYHIPEHRGVSRAMLVSHLALIIPGDGSECRIRVHDQTRNWREGKVLIFDDNYLHEVWNDSGKERVVLFMNLDRPMRFWGRQVHALFLFLLQFSAFYKEPAANLKKFAHRFAAAKNDSSTTDV